MALADAPQPAHWIGPVCPACSRLLPVGAPLSREHVGSRAELVPNDPHFPKRTVRLDGQDVLGACEVAPAWSGRRTLVVRRVYGTPCRCGRSDTHCYYAVVEAGRVTVA